MSSFGIIITTYIGDFYLTKALLASIKMFMPDVPICIIQDGDFSLEDIKKVYRITHVIKKADVKDEFLRNNCFGSRCTNLVALEESPFEKFLYLDSDLVLWGNILENIDLDKFDFIHNAPHEPYTEKVYKGQYFDYDRIFEHIEYFNWKESHFFNAGVFIAKRNVFTKSELEDLVMLWKRDKTLMPAEPQGFLNILAFRDKEKQRIRVGEAHLQTVVPVIANSTLEDTFQVQSDLPVIKYNTIIHWAGIKPLMMNAGKVFLAPELYFRRQHLKNMNSAFRIFGDAYFYYEEYKSLLDRYHKGSVALYIKRKIASKIK